MNLLQIINVRWWNAEASYALNLSKGLRDRGHKVTILGLPHSPVIRRAEEENFPILTSFDLWGFNPYTLYKGFRGFLRFLNQERFDVINAHRSEGYCFVALAAKLAQNKPALVRTRGDMRPVRNNPLNRFLYGKWTDKVITSGEVIRRNLCRDLFLSAHQVQTIYGSVDLQRFHPFLDGRVKRKELTLEENVKLIGIIGRVGYIKGHQYLIAAASKIIQIDPSVRFLLAIKEEDEDIVRLKDLIGQLHLSPYFILTGFHPDIEKVMAALDIGIVTSIGSEANCRVVLELMASGKPIVATQVGIIPEVIDNGVNGVLVPPKNSEALAEAIGFLLKNPEKARSLAQEARKTAERRFNIHRLVEETEAVYREALKVRLVR
ncbi:MAG TPA: glycosyltransferase family 4 protein [Candidatus Limnocylindrales bacterium]|nr:glycosyltransferase family 4 protein [Candidatus Limnocylindrales bacterium]